MNHHKPLYRGILKKAWQITWSRKELWIFGFFATILQTSSVAEVLVRTVRRLPTGGFEPLRIAETAFPGAGFIGTMSIFRDQLRAPGLGSILIIALTLVILISLLWFVSTCEGALIWGARGVKRLPGILESFKRSGRVGWKIVAIHILSQLLLGAAFLLTSLPFLLALQSGTTETILWFSVSLLIALPLTLVISFMTIFAVSALVIDRKPFFQALETAWLVTKRHFTICIETALILFAVNTLAGISAALAVLLLSIPATLILAAAFIAGSGAVVSVVITLFLVLTLLLALALGTLTTTFGLVSWTLLYQKLSRGGAVAKIVRLFQAIPRFFARRI